MPYLSEGTESLLDIGAGAGFPGVPLKIAFPQLKLMLVDSVGKKTGFLGHVVEELGLEDVEVHTGAGGGLGSSIPTARESFDVVVTRGVAVMRVLMELTLPFCRTGGTVMTWKKGELGAGDFGFASCDGGAGRQVAGGGGRECRGVAGRAGDCAGGQGEGES